MKVHLQCCRFGKLTVNLEVADVAPTTTIRDLLVIYFERVVKTTNPNMQLESALQHKR